MFLEIFRWKHVTPSLRFNPGPPLPDGTKPRPGLPLIFVFVAAALAPVTFLTIVIMGWARPVGSRGARIPGHGRLDHRHLAAGLLLLHGSASSDPAKTTTSSNPPPGLGLARTSAP